MTNAGRVVTHETIRRKVWGSPEYVSSSTVKKNIAQLRRKLGDDSGSHRMILNERGVGYRFLGANKPSLVTSP